MSENHTAQPDKPQHNGATATDLAVSGMTCNNCARHVTEAIQSVPGVQSASVTLEAGRARIRWNSGAPADVPAVLASIKEAGYDAKVVEKTEHQHEHKTAGGWQANLWIGVLGTLPLMIGEWVFRLGEVRWFQWFSFALAGVVQVFAGAPFYRGAWRQLKVNRSNMDTLVALGSTTAFGYSVWVMLTGHGSHVYFMEAAAIITLISVGHWIEARVSTRASSALKALLNLAPPTARRLEKPPGHSEDKGQFSPLDIRRFDAKNKEQATESVVPVSELEVGDLVALRPGDHVPTDGVVVEGHSAVDEAMLTGESVPVDKSPRHELYAGTINLNSRLVMRVTATGESTALAHIIAAVQRAQTSRANIQRLGDRVSNVFVPVVVFIAIATQLWWAFLPAQANQVYHWLSRFLWAGQVPSDPVAAAFVCAAAVLIVACPCAMGLATPAAIMASANAAARRGILIRDGVALEKAGHVTAVIFDKTGTLTVGKPEVARTWKANGKVENAEALAAALARNSAHPISQALAKLASDGPAFSDWREVRGAGVEAKLSSPDSNRPQPKNLARLGSLNWLRETGVNLAAGERFVAEWSAQGATIVGLAVEDSLAGLFAVKDTLKSGAIQVVRQLQRQNLKVHLLTGDNRRTADGIAKQVGIPTENVFAEVRPEQKAEFVKQLQEKGERVAFVGDGINDAPALEQADLGIAVSRASDVAREAADVILLKSEIEAVPEALGLSKATLRTIKQNLFWAFFYNVISLPLAALGFMSPILCAAAMGCSDLIVIGNALRLRRWRIRV